MTTDARGRTQAGERVTMRIVIRRTGGPDVMTAERIDLPAPGPGEVAMRNEAIGLNFIDTYHRSGLYPVPLPSGIGLESAGVVDAVGPNVEGLAAGDRIGVFAAEIGAYATSRIVPADRVVRLPAGISAETAAATMLKGCTAEFLVERCARIEAGQTVLVHAAAGGVGQLLVAWLKAIGARVIAHAGSPAKAALAQGLGADHALSCPLDALAAQVRDLTDGDGVACVFDGVGADSWAASLASVARRGLIVSYGNASGPPPAVAPAALAAAGSVFLTRPTLFDYVRGRSALQASADRLFAMIAAGAVRPSIGARYPLAEAAAAHAALEARRTSGATLLVP